MGKIQKINAIYISENAQIDVPIVDSQVWLSQKVMAELYGVSVQAIGQHVNNVIADDELSEESTIKKIFIVADDGKKRQVLHYNLEIVLTVGYRVNSKKAGHFRKWANDILQTYLTKGIAINEPALANIKSETLDKVASRSVRAIVNAYRERGLSDAMIQERINGIVDRHTIMDMLKASVTDTVYYGKFTNQTYEGLFNRNADQLTKANGGYKPRDGMAAPGLHLLAAAESAASRLIGERGYLRFFEALVIMDKVTRELKSAIIGLQKLLGIDLGTNQSLLPPGNGDSVA